MDDFQKIIRRLRNGDMEPIKQLYASMTKKCIGYIVNRGGTSNDAQDLLQDALFVFYKKVKEDENFILTAPVEAYVFKIFHNKWLELFRSKGYKNVYFDLDDEGNKIKENITDEELLPDDFALSESVHPVIKLMDQLGKDCKKVLLAFYVHKQSLEAIAEDLEFTYNYVKVKRFRCAEQLRKLYLNDQTNAY